MKHQTMLSMKLDSLVHHLVNQLLIKPHGRPDQALHFHFDVSMWHYASEGNMGERHGLHLLYFLRPGHTYVTVFSAVAPSILIKANDPSLTWVHEVTHDSCWRNIDAFSKLYFDMANRINERREKLGLRSIAPRDMDEHNNFGLFADAFDWLKVDVTTDPADPSRYRKNVKVLGA